jgi:hypothetical protein
VTVFGHAEDVSVPSMAGTDTQLFRASAGVIRSCPPTGVTRVGGPLVEGDPSGGWFASRSTGAPAVENRVVSDSRFPAYPLSGAGGVAASGAGFFRLTRFEPPAQDERPSHPMQAVSGLGRK